MLPVGCAWCGLPLNVERHDHRACAADRPRPFGEMPLWHYWRDHLSDSAITEAARLHGEEIEMVAARWATGAGLDEHDRAEYVVATKTKALELGFEQMFGVPTYAERRTMREIVAAERRLIAGHRAPDGAGFAGVV